MNKKIDDVVSIQISNHNEDENSHQLIKDELNSNIEESISNHNNDENAHKNLGSIECNLIDEDDTHYFWITKLR